MATIYGPLFSQANLEAAVIAQLQSRTRGLVRYLAELERQNDLNPHSLDVPPSPASFRGGIDFEPYQGDESPLLIVNVQPTGVPERREGGDYAQLFEIQIASVIMAEDENAARLLANHYGIATVACVLQHGSFDLDVVQETILTRFPQAEFVDPSGSRNVMRTVAVFHTEVQPVVGERYGPIMSSLTEPADPYDAPGDFPTVQTVDTTITAETLS